MKVLKKTLVFSALSLMLVACGTTEEESVNTGGQTEDDQTNTEVAEEAGLSVTILDATDEEISVEVNGEALTFGAELYTTTFGKEVKVVEGTTFEYTESRQPTAVAVFEEGSLLSDVTFMIEQNLNLEGDQIRTREVDVELEMDLQSSSYEIASHVNEFNIHEINDETVPFQFYFEIAGDASKPGNWSEAIRGQEYKQYTFVEVTEEGRHFVHVRFPASVEEDVVAVALAMALSYNTVEGTDVEEETDEEDTNE
ncbi:hypothetical protein ACERII_21485 [Evansella sp. AB-rgal1]|uniref:hypothetical protein n=1 Tax=Evansella sp. AB-rgal1 TaxID=3242696 RepID=UPI00359E686A